jgi:hypothetical protein
VPDEQADDAHRQLVANMDRIARAAKRPPSGSARRRPRPVLGAGDQRDPERRLTSSRMLRLSRPLGVLLVGLLLTAAIPGGLRLPIVVLTVAAVIYVVGKQAQDGQDSP